MSDSGAADDKDISDLCLRLASEVHQLKDAQLQWFETPERGGEQAVLSKTLIGHLFI